MNLALLKQSHVESVCDRSTIPATVPALLLCPPFSASSPLTSPEDLQSKIDFYLKKVSWRATVPCVGDTASRVERGVRDRLEGGLRGRQQGRRFLRRLGTLFRGALALCLFLKKGNDQSIMLPYLERKYQSIITTTVPPRHHRPRWTAAGGRWRRTGRRSPCNLNQVGWSRKFRIRNCVRLLACYSPAPKRKTDRQPYTVRMWP